MKEHFRETLYHVISASFCVIVVLSNLISAKMVPLPFFNFIIPAGLVFYPLSFLLSDLITELFGAQKAKKMVYIAFSMTLLSLGIVQIALWLPGHDHEIEEAFQSVLGLSGLRIFASLVAYAIAQIVAIQTYAWIKKITHERFLWLRNNGSAIFSQIIDTIAIDVIFLYWGLGMSMQEVLPIMLFSYFYKTSFNLFSTPFLYAALFVIEKLEKEVHRQKV